MAIHVAQRSPQQIKYANERAHGNFWSFIMPFSSCVYIEKQNAFTKREFALMVGASTTCVYIENTLFSL